VSNRSKLQHCTVQYWLTRLPSNCDECHVTTCGPISDKSLSSTVISASWHSFYLSFEYMRIQLMSWICMCCILHSLQSFRTIQYKLQVYRCYLHTCIFIWCCEYAWVVVFTACRVSGWASINSASLGVIFIHAYLADVMNMHVLQCSWPAEFPDEPVQTALLWDADWSQVCAQHWPRCWQHPRRSTPHLQPGLAVPHSNSNDNNNKNCTDDAW